MGYWEPEVVRLVTGMWEKDYQEWKMFFHIMFMSQAAWKKCGLVRGNYLRLSFFMHAVVDRYFLSFLFAKLTLIAPRSAQTGEICVIYYVFLNLFCFWHLQLKQWIWRYEYWWTSIFSTVQNSMGKNPFVFPLNFFTKFGVPNPGLRTTRLTDLL